MELAEIRNTAEWMEKKLDEYKASLDLESKIARIEELENEMTYPDFWNNQESAQKVIDESNGLKAMVDKYKELEAGHENVALTYELIKEEPDVDLQEELESELGDLKKKFEDFELQIL
jgi:peptide chain release factor 2